jgi:hypothetical protein
LKSILNPKSKVMNKHRVKTFGFALLMWIIDFTGAAQQPYYPVKVSENGRYITDQDNNPVFWLGTTQWQIFRDYTLDEARITIEKSKSNGFIFIQAMLMGVGDGTKANIFGEKAWLNDNPITPNEAYFLHVDSVIRVAREYGIIFSITLYHQRYRNYITLEKARLWAKWLSSRYRSVPNIVWSMTPEAKDEFIPVLRELAAGLNEGDGGAHPITFKPDPAPYSSSFIHGESWLDFNSMQTWNAVRLIYPMVMNDYNLKPVKPVLMAEGAYEQGSEYGFDVTPLWIRRQAYYSFLAGAHHTYGHNDSWRVLPSWKQALDAPGAFQMGILKKVFLGLKEWWYLVPDQSVLTSGGRIDGDLLKLAARHKDGKWIMIYLAEKSSFTVDLGKLASRKKVKASWINPATGNSTSAGRFKARGEKSFETPAGMEDSILIIESGS